MSISFSVSFVQHVTFTQTVGLNIDVSLRFIMLKLYMCIMLSMPSLTEIQTASCQDTDEDRLPY